MNDWMISQGRCDMQYLQILCVRRAVPFLSVRHKSV